jgi:uncharacterized membrane protein YoaT (DUF817 family)
MYLNVICNTLDDAKSLVPINISCFFLTFVIWLAENKTVARCWWLTPAILATEEIEIRRIAVQSQSLAPSIWFPRPHFKKKKESHA